jgi:D-glycero-D-manno-heptose 1,7-bisphosphate phosphatase
MHSADPTTSAAATSPHDASSARTGSRAAIFLDRDGVLVEDVDLLFEPEQVRLEVDAPEALRRLHDAGFALIATTNQTVVSRGLATLDDVAAIHAHIDRLIREAGGTALDAWYVCPHHPHATMAGYRMECECRKPRPGLLMTAARDHELDLRRSFMVGDRITDVVAGHAAGCRTIQLRRGAYEAPPIVVVAPLPPIEADHCCDSLSQVADWIVETTRCELSS